MPRPIGILGGSGLYELLGLADARREKVVTPFGVPSDAYVLGRLDGQDLAFLPRHGVGHRIDPSRVNYRANIHGFKQLGVSQLVSISAVGSMREEIAPGHLVLVDQFIDRTATRSRTFFEDGIVAHVSLAEPTCGGLRAQLKAAALAAGATVHPKGTYLCIEGPQFSTRAESLWYRQMGADVIGMTNLPEARLAREAELCFATLALSTDYDCWREGHDAVTAAEVVAVLHANVARAREVVRNLAAGASGQGPATCACGSALDHAILTNPTLIPQAAKERCALLLRGRV